MAKSSKVQDNAMYIIVNEIPIFRASTEIYVDAR